MTDRTTSAVSIRGASRRFGAVRALDDVSLEIAAGDVACLVGQSGCGKSTLLRVIAGVEDADCGTVAIGGRTVTGPGSFVEPEDRNVGFMFQDYALFPHLSVRQNVLFGLRRLGRTAAAARAHDTLARLGIRHLEDRYPHMLSGGEQQRVALARALAPQPALLLMDEPFSNLDQRLRDAIRRETAGILRDLGATAVIVTHDPEEALSLGDQVVLMQAGRIVEAGTGDAIYRRPRTAYSAEFFSRFNRVPARRVQDRLESPLGSFSCPGPGTGDGDGDGDMLLYIRPQSITLESAGIPARVASRTLLGEIEEVGLDVAGVEQPLVMRSSRHSGVDVGHTVYLRIDPEEVLAFEAMIRPAAAPA